MERERWQVASERKWKMRSPKGGLPAFFVFLLFTSHFSRPIAARADDAPAVSIAAPPGDAAAPAVSIENLPALVSLPAEGGPLRLVHPAEGARLGFVRSTFMYGSADPRGELTLNGQPVPIHPGGGFLAMVPLSTGSFTVRAELRLSTGTVLLTRQIYVAPPPQPSPASPLTVEYVKPDTEREVLPGEEIVVTAKGSPGLEAHFQIENVKGKFPMVENGGGIYQGAYIVHPRDVLEGSAVRVTLMDRKRGGKISKEAPGRLSLLNERVPRVVEVSTSIAVLRSGPALGPGDKGGYMLFPPPGVRLRVTGRRGQEFKVQLSPSRSAWIGVDEVRLLPEGTPVPAGVVGSPSVSSRDRHAAVRVPVGAKLPFEIRAAADGGRLDVVFFGAVSNTDWMHHDSSEGPVGLLEWRQDEAQTYRLTVYTAPGSWWGYDGRYEGTTFVLELRRPPSALYARSPLEGLTIAVDAGHSSDNGAVGPTGFLEKDANLAIALCLQKKLLAEGATAYMLRGGDEHVGLYDRPKLAWESKADMLISIHNNALPEGGNPLEKNGYGVYYFHPHSFALAQAVHRAYGRIVGRDGGREKGLRDDGLHYGNLALARTPQMPAVLTESAYMIVPAEEALLKTEAFQCDCAEAMLRGLREYAGRFRTAAGPEGKVRKKR